MNHPIHISVITPVYKCADSVAILYERLASTLSTITNSFEVIMVDDACPNNSWAVITGISEKDSRVRGIKLSRNFGQHHAITAGLDYSKGDWVIVMDCDLQDQPEEIIKLYSKAQEGFDIVVGKRLERKDGFFKKLGSSFFSNFFNYFTDSQIDKSIGNFGIYTRKVIDSIRQFNEQHRSFGLFVLWSGFNRVEIPIEHAKRESGKSSYTTLKLISFAIDSIISHSNKPLKISVIIGFSLSFVSLIYSLVLVINYFLWSTPVAGWTSLIVSLYFLSGLIIGSIGMVGLYIGKTFDEVKRRPLYLIQNTTFESERNAK